MIELGKDELICDLAETYHVFNYKDLPPSLVAVLAVGLHDDARIYRKVNGSKTSNIEILLASCVDQLNYLAWTKTVDAEKGRNRPKSVVKILLGETEQKQCTGFVSGDDFEEYRRQIIERSKTWQI